jgi:hypothetical protein
LHVKVALRERVVVENPAVVQPDFPQRRGLIGAVPVVDELVELPAHQREWNRLAPVEQIGPLGG